MPHFMPVDPSRLALMANYLRRPAEIELFYGGYDFAWQGSQGSRAEKERVYPGTQTHDFMWHPRVQTFVHAQIRLGVTALAEQSLAIGRLITDPDIGVHGILGVEACARSAVENGAKAWWLLDPEIDAHQRIRRYWLEQLYSAFAAETLASQMGWALPVDELGFSPTSHRVRRSCLEMGLTVGGDRRKPLVDGESRPTATDMVSDLLDATVFRESKEMVYRLLSATTHGTAYGMLRAYRPTDETHLGERIVERIADHRIIESAASVTLESFAVLMDRVVDFMGWDHWKITSFRNMVGNLVTTGPR
jgi:hypothetical protein